MPKVGEFKKAPNLYMGIDPGAHGGIVVVAKGCLASYKMPPTEQDLWDIISKYGWMYDGEVGRLGTEPRQYIHAVVEKVGGYIGGEGNTGSTMFKFGTSYGCILMALTAARIPFDLVTPQVWQKAMGIGTRSKTESKGQFKNRIKQKAQQLFPGTKVILDTSDALVIAEYCRRKQEGRL